MVNYARTCKETLLASFAILRGENMVLTVNEGPSNKYILTIKSIITKCHWIYKRLEKN